MRFDSFNSVSMGIFGFMVVIVIVRNKVNDQTHAAFLQPASEALQCQIGVGKMMECQADKYQVKIEEFGTQELIRCSLREEIAVVGC